MNKLVNVIVIFAIFPISLYAASTDEMRSWNEDLSAFTTNLENAEPIDKFLSQQTTGHASVTFENTVYTAFTQSDGTETHVYLSRFHEGDIKVWDDDVGTNGGWNTDLQRADPIDATIDGQASKDPALAVDLAGNVYIAYAMEDTIASNNYHLYLSRLNATTARIEIWDGGAQHWTTTRTDVNAVADGIDAERDTTSQQISGAPKMAISGNDVLIGYLQSDGTQNHLYLTRYDASAVEIQGWNSANYLHLSVNGLPFTTITNDFEDAGDEIDHIVRASHTKSFDMATGGTKGHVYFVYVQEDYTPDFHLGITRYNGQTEVVERWNNNAQSWTFTPTNADDNADFIDAKAVSASTANVTGSPHIVVNSINDAYIVYDMDDATPDSHVYMVRYDDSVGQIQWWDTGTGGFNGGGAIGPHWGSYGDEANDSLDNQVAARDADSAKLVIDGNDDVYVAFLQQDATGNEDHIYLTRMVAATETIEHWSDDTETWETDPAAQRDATDMIDLNVSASSSSAFKMAVDNKNDIYIAYIQQDSGGTNNHLKLTRYDTSTALVEGWNVDSLLAFTTDLSLVNPIDISTSAQTSQQPDIVVVDSGIVYIPYLQLREQQFGSTTHLQMNAFIAANTVPTGSVNISGDATEGQTLAASNTLDDIDGLGTITYQWNRDGQAIPGATAASHTLTDTDVSSAISVTASYTDGKGTSESVTSNPTATVAGLNNVEVDSNVVVGSSGGAASMPLTMLMLLVLTLSGLVRRQKRI